MVRIMLAIGLVLGLVGLLWIGQGVGWIGGSFMSGQSAWAVIGAGCLIFGALVVRGALRLRAAPPSEND